MKIGEAVYFRNPHSLDQVQGGEVVSFDEDTVCVAYGVSGVFDTATTIGFWPRNAVFQTEAEVRESMLERLRTEISLAKAEAAK